MRRVISTILVCSFLGIAGAVGYTAVKGIISPPVSRETNHRLSRDQILTQAKAKFDAGDGFAALAIINENAGSDMLRTDPEVRALQRSIIAKMNAENEPQRAEAVAERLSGFWTDQVQKVSTDAPATVPEIMQREMVFQDAARALEEAREFKNDPKVLAASTALRTALKVRQSVVLPVLRRYYCQMVGAAVWRNDVTVTANGRHIRFTGAIFAANANIEDAEGAVRLNISHLRFSRIEYAWHKQSDVTYHDLETPNDTVIGYWDDDTFTAVNNP